MEVQVLSRAQQMNDVQILVIGAGAAGLMAARELSKHGKKVIILEARNRIGGRIWTINDFGIPLEAGAEFVHGHGTVTKQLLQEAGLTFGLVEGDYWSTRTGETIKNGPIIPGQEKELHKKLHEIPYDISVGQFLKNYFPEEKHSHLRNAVIKIVEGYDAANVDRASTFAIRDEWAGGQEWEQGRIKEGYGKLLSFLEIECRKNGVEIIFDIEVKSIDYSNNTIVVISKNEKKFFAEQVVITVPLPLLYEIDFTPTIPDKLSAVEKIGFGPAFKIFLEFKDQWWAKLKENDFSTLQMITTNESIDAWWTQYPSTAPILTGWAAGDHILSYTNLSSGEILDIALKSLSNTFKIEMSFLKDELVQSKIINWPMDKFTQGGYSYATPESKEAQKVLSKPINNKIFFAGEALYSGKDTATVEGALGSGLEVTEKILGK